MHPYRRQYTCDLIDGYLNTAMMWTRKATTCPRPPVTRDGTVTRLPLPAEQVFLPRRVSLGHDKRNLRIAVPDSSVLVYARLVGELHTLFLLTDRKLATSLVAGS